MSDRLSRKIRRDFQRLMGVEREERGPVARKKVRRSGWTLPEVGKSSSSRLHGCHG